MNQICFMDEIRFEEALKLIEAGETVKLKFVTLDVRRKTGGKIREFVGVITKPKHQRENNNAVLASSGKRNHYTNFTRNFYSVLNGHVTMDQRTVHLPLILEVNGRKMML